MSNVPVSTPGIVLRCFPYGDTSLIATIFTEKLGKQSYLIRGARNKRQKALKGNLFEVGNYLQLLAYANPKKGLQTIRECSIEFKMSAGITSDFYRKSIFQYGTEFLYKALLESEPLPELFSEVELFWQKILYEKEAKLANIPILFTLQVLKCLGFEIQNDYTSEKKYFNIRTGCFSSFKQDVIHFADENISRILSMFLSYGEFGKELNGAQRLEVLQYLLRFLNIHTHQNMKINSLEILHGILHED